MNKYFRIVFLVVLVITTSILLLSCSSGSSSGSSEESQVRAAVTRRLKVDYLGTTVNGIELASSSGTISTLRKVSDTKYTAYGKITYKDIYGNSYNRDYTASVENNGSSWTVRDISYK